MYFLGMFLRLVRALDFLTAQAAGLRGMRDPEILALAVSLEEEDGRVYADFAEGLRETYPATTLGSGSVGFTI